MSTSNQLVPGAAGRSFWVDDALAAEGPTERRVAAGPLEADVCVIGGGYTGLWTAVRLLALEPSLRVIVVEASICGSGASGRNGGLALNYWTKIEGLEARVGRDRAAWLARASDRAIAEIGEFCVRHGVDAGFKHGGWVWTATCAAQLDSWKPIMEAAADYGEEPLRVLGPDELLAQTGSPAHLAGVLDERAASVQPARLARGLRRVAIEKGVDIYEDSPAISLDRDAGIVKTAKATIRAESVVVATNAWALGIPELRNAAALVSADVIATEPIPEAVSRHGFDSGTSITNSRLTVRTVRGTDDGRIMFGHSGGALSYGGRMIPDFVYNEERTQLNLDELPRYFPDARGAKVTHAWAGAVDRSPDGLPYYGLLPGNRRIPFAIGMSGNGVGPCLLAGRVLASLALGRRDEWTECGLAEGVTAGYPPEPIRYLAGQAVRSAVIRSENLQEEGRPVDRLTQTVTKFTPQAFFKASKSD